ncbi:hypothetical protein NDU88_001950 [Pleurodeles waltl]|uniref:Secreted protein n=1 Tax=Pleurodeles waltl TaxID=8319 RepID=A0AAV7VB42_PLEWA|nr:hypothetical protein NDU88_001950 [Pleurodeles waltl]
MSLWSSVIVSMSNAADVVVCVAEVVGPAGVVVGGAGVEGAAGVVVGGAEVVGAADRADMMVAAVVLAAVVVVAPTFVANAGPPWLKSRHSPVAHSL